MTDFKEKIRIGLEAAAQSDRNNAEISSVFESIESQLVELGVPAKIELGELDPIEAIGLPIAAPRHSRNTLLLCGEHKVFQLGQFATSEAGYPCAFIYGSDVALAHDRASLEAILGDLFSTMRVGQMLRALSVY